MPRFNAFYMIHKALRAMMYDVSLSLQHTDFAHSSDHPQSLEKLVRVLDVFDAHAGHEDSYIFPLLQACNPGLQEEMEQEHVTDIALSHDLRSLVAKYKASSDAEEKRALGNRICYIYYAFVAFNLSHLNKEEVTVNESLWGHYTDQDIIQANMRMVATLPPAEVEEAAVWMMRGCSNPDIINWLNSIKKQAPGPVINLLLGIAEAELPPHRFASLRSAVMETA